MLSKQDAIRRHAQRRAHERFGFDLTDEIHDELVANCKKQSGKKVSCRIFIFRTIYLERHMRIVYDRKRELIVSFLKVKDAGGMKNEF
jgi:metal-dependent HD superfamily phosphatase/phosphodiesterase